MDSTRALTIAIAIWLIGMITMLFFFAIQDNERITNSQEFCEFKKGFYGGGNNYVIECINEDGDIKYYSRELLKDQVDGR